MATRSIPQLPTNVPIPPSSTLERFSFPGDLVQSNRGFYTQIEMVEYSQRTLQDKPFLNPIGGVLLPLPKTINDTQVVTWNEVEGYGLAASILHAGATALGSGGGRGIGGGLAAGAVSAAASSAAGLAAGLGGAVIGKSINPFLTMLFKGPNFKEHTLSWSFAPANARESQALSDIIHYFKFNMLPEAMPYSAGALLDYPHLAIIKMYPKDEFLWKFKPCAILAVQIDYTGAGGPSFHPDGSPTVINLTLQLKEIEYHLRNSYSK